MFVRCFLTFFVSFYHRGRNCIHLRRWLVGMCVVAKGSRRMYLVDGCISLKFLYNVNGTLYHGCMTCDTWHSYFWTRCVRSTRLNTLGWKYVVSFIFLIGVCMKLVMVWVTECLFHVGFFSARRRQQLSGKPSEQRSYIICPPLAPHKEHAPSRHHRVAPDYFWILLFFLVLRTI